MLGQEGVHRTRLQKVLAEDGGVEELAIRLGGSLHPPILLDLSRNRESCRIAQRPPSGTLPLAIEHTTWIERVLPGLGYDQRRLLEVSLPPPLPNHGSAASEFDKAKRAIAERRYTDCVAACRGLIGIWEQALGSTRARPVATVVAERLGWESTDLRRRFVDDLWKAANDISNVPHHPEGQTSAPQPVDARDARLLFFLVTGLSEYLGTL